jgi:EAL domain-containing protein (putative c-di-GMP-specific phosphodiesterase class I)/GGDEF domain-containing protein
VSINAVSELVTAVFEKSSIINLYTYSGVVISQNFYFLFHAALCPMLYNYVCCVTGKSRKRSSEKIFLIHIPFFITEVLVVLNPIFNCIFFYDDNLVFTRNWGEYLIYWAAVFYFFLSVSELFFSWNAITPRRSITLSYLFLIVFAGVVIQLINFDIKSELFAEALALMGAMLAIESEDDRIHADTGIYNRRALHMDIHNILIMKEKANLIFIKINNAGVVERVTRSANFDILASAIADYLKCIVPRYCIYHPNKECFIIILNSNDKIDVNGIKNEITNRFYDEWRIYGSTFKLNATIIDTVIPDEVDSFENIVYIADAIIPQSVAVNNAEMDWLMRRAEVEKTIKRSVVKNNFEVYFQPTLHSNGKKIHGAEALVRMKDSSIGYISPEEFIPIAEQIGLVDEIDDFVLREVCQFIESGVLEKYDLDCINVNLSVIQCLKPGFFEHILNIVDEYNIYHSAINFEITESVGAENYRALSFVARQLKSAGFNLSMDDYGTGYSNMEGIFSLEFDVVKIDKSILWGAEKSLKGRIILENSINMIKGLGCHVLVEGVETEKQLELLKEYGVDYFQGYYFSKPMPKSLFLEYLAG